MTTKTCTRCGEMKQLDEYHRSKSKRGGRRTECKTCQAERERHYREANREQIAEQRRRYREENLEKEAERKRRHYEENREAIAERKRRYREENREEEAESQRRRREENRDLSKAMATVPPHTPWTSEEDALLMADNGMTTFQKAIELGRTYESAESRRHKLRARFAAA